jgi:hypothetical protein
VIPHDLFKLCMGCLHRSCGTTIQDFNESKHYNFFNMLLKYFKNELKFNSIQIRQYVTVLAKIHENSFDPWKLDSQEYFNDFKAWYKVNSSKDAYLNNVKESVKTIIKFCKTKKIKKLEDYVKNWGVTHYISGVLNENVAYAIGLHELTLSKPEKFMVKRFLKNVPMIKERLEREGRLKVLLEDEIKQAKEMLIWIS